MALKKAGNSSEANIVYDELEKKFKNSEDPVIKQQMVNSRFYKKINHHF